MSNQVMSILSVATIPQVISMIIKNSKIDESTAINKFYKSRTYELLSDEETGVWHFSPLTIYNMWVDEIKTGKINIPVEG